MVHVSHIVNSVFNSRTYIISSDVTNYVWLVDCGDIDKLPSDIEVKGVLLTHAHFDHIYGLHSLFKRFPKCIIATNEIGRFTLTDARMNMSMFHEKPIEVFPPLLILCKDSDKIKLFEDVYAEIYETPGHHPSCVTFSVENYLFTGDSYIPGIKTITTLPKGNKILSDLSIERIKKLANSKIICAGHD